MHYPIFKSIVNTLDTKLEQRGIKTERFKTWEDNKIHATGLEILINLSKMSTFIEALSINFDWDSFRETQLANRMEGMESHPFLKIETLTESSVDPVIDIEMSWFFNVERCQPQMPGASGNYRIEQASQWMEKISKTVNQVLAEDDIITRWHFEIEGDKHGKYLSAIHLISYFQYSLAELKTLPDVQHFVSKKLQDLLLKANKVIFQSDKIIDTSVAA